MSITLTARLSAGAILSSVLLVMSPASATTTSDYETQIKKQTNVERVERDRVKVTRTECVDRYAESHARWMAEHHELEHQELGPILDKCNLTGVSENIAYGYTSGYKTVAAWMNSSGHRKNLLASKMRYMGVGAVKDSDGRWWVAQVFGTRT